ncbi:YfiR family protein [Zhongshania sp. BJYM1]|uniref:YfiR family protein n=1 Tax=Zhongshania aquatica TaxID=2965069 RepID=UPI0022B34133|nr:YfiR family protein [Marortus sp. BJYM1]
MQNLLQTIMRKFYLSLQLFIGVITLSDRAILTVSDNDNFIKLGGMIQLLIDNGKIRFDINRSATDRADLKVSSKLLGLARNVN